MRARTFFLALGALGGISACAEATLVYATDIRNNRFVTFDTLTPGTQTVLNAAFATDYFGMDFDATATNLYGVRGTAGALNLDQVSLADGSMLGTVAITGAGAADTVTGISFDTANNAYLSTNGGGASRLFGLNVSTGVATLIGTMSANIIIDIAVDAGGRMVAHDISTDTFHFVNTSTGALTLIGTHSLAANFAQGMDFDWSNGTLYAAVYTGGGTLTYGSVNLSTGAVTSIPGILSGEYEMAVASAVPEPASMIALGAGALALIARRRRK